MAGRRIPTRLLNADRSMRYFLLKLLSAVEASACRHQRRRLRHSASALVSAAASTYETAQDIAADTRFCSSCCSISPFRSCRRRASCRSLSSSRSSPSSFYSRSLRTCHVFRRSFHSRRHSSSRWRLSSSSRSFSSRFRGRSHVGLRPAFSLGTRSLPAVHRLRSLSADNAESGMPLPAFGWLLWSWCRVGYVVP